MDYEKLALGCRVRDKLGKWYTVVGITDEHDPHARTCALRPLVEFCRESDGVTQEVSRERYLDSMAEARPAGYVTPTYSAIKFKS